MIFIILGTQKFQFNRLLESLDDHIIAGNIKDTVYAQTGFSDYHPKNFEYIDFLTKDLFEEKIIEATIIITHSGVGSIITSISNNKPTIVVPRKAKFKEHIDDHQYQIAKAFAEKNLVLLCEDLKYLPQFIEESKHTAFSRYTSGNKKIIEIIQAFLEKS